MGLLLQPILNQPAANPARRRQAEGLGRQAEEEVAALMRRRGFSLLARRLRTGADEIDLAVADGGTLVFIEVKARRSFAAAAEAVSPRQQARLFEAANLALALHPDWQRANTRFDVALVCGGRIQIIEDAIRYQ
jgi:putative endonuclease